MGESNLTVIKKRGNLDVYMCAHTHAHTHKHRNRKRRHNDQSKVFTNQRMSMIASNLQKSGGGMEQVLPPVTLARTNPLDTLILDLQPPQLKANTFLFAAAGLKDPTMGARAGDYDLQVGTLKIDL